MIAALVTGIAAAPWMRVVLHGGAIARAGVRAVSRQNECPPLAVRD